MYWSIVSNLKNKRIFRLSFFTFNLKNIFNVRLFIPKEYVSQQLFHQEHIWSDGLIPPMNFLLHELISPMDFCLLSYLLVNFFRTTFLSLQLFFGIEFFEKDETS